MIFSKADMVISDILTGRFNHALASYHLHPSVEVKKISDRQYLLITPNLKTGLSFVVDQGDSFITKSLFLSNFVESWKLHA